MRVLISPFFALVLAFAAVAAQSQPAPQALPQITVTGQGRVAASPDIATISLGVTTQARTAANAMAENSTQMAAVLANLRAAGLEDRDLQTSGLSLSPNIDYSSSGQITGIKGYTASNQLTAVVRKLEDLGTILDAAVKDGANTLNGVSFGLANPEPKLDEARKRAVADARRRAELLATAAGVGLGAVQSIAEQGGYSGPQPQFRMDSAAMAEAVPVAEGEVSLSASVTIVWALTN